MYISMYHHIAALPIPISFYSQDYKNSTSFFLLIASIFDRPWWSISYSHHILRLLFESPYSVLYSSRHSFVSQYFSSFKLLPAPLSDIPLTIFYLPVRFLIEPIIADSFPYLPVDFLIDFKCTIFFYWFDILLANLLPKMLGFLEKVYFGP